MWSKKYCDNNQNTPLKDVIGNFIEYIQFHKIPATVLMQEVNPLGLVPPEIIMNALAYQVRVALSYIYIKLHFEMQKRKEKEKTKNFVICRHCARVSNRRRDQFLYEGICCRQTQPVSTPGNSPPTE